MPAMTSETASALLGVSPREVRRLAAQGRLPGARYLGRTLVLDSEAVHRLAREPRRRGRPWSERVAWAALSLLSGGAAAWLSSAELSRLKHRIRKIAVDDLRYLASRRAGVLVFRAHPAVLPALAGYVVPTGASALSAAQLRELGLTDADRHLDGYVPASELAGVQAKYGLVEDPSGNVTLRAVTVEDAFSGGVAPRAAIMMDLAGSLDTRESAAARREIGTMIKNTTSRGG
jgi:excisionase family DNA binding protein